MYQVVYFRMQIAMNLPSILLTTLNQMSFDELFLSHLGGIENNCLSDILDMHNGEVNEFQIGHSP